MKIFQILGIIFLLLLTVVASLFLYFAYSDSNLNISSKKYVDATIPQILSAWSKEALLSRASTEFCQAATDEKLVALFQKLTQLGPFQKYEGSSGRVNISWSTQNGKIVTARYIAMAKFDKGDARIKIQLIQRRGEWQIMSFFIE